MYYVTFFQVSPPSLVIRLILHLLQGRSLNAIKAELIRAFLTIHELSHSVVGQNSFRVEYKRGPTAGGSVFSRGVRMQVDILLSQPPDTSPGGTATPSMPPQV